MRDGRIITAHLLEDGRRVLPLCATMLLLRPALFTLWLLTALAAAITCGGSDAATPSPTTAQPTSTRTPEQTTAATPSATVSATPEPTPPPTPPPTPHRHT